MMVKIGVTAHRVLAEIDKIKAGIEKAVGRVTELHTEESLTVISSLAEGADRLVAQHIIERAARARLIVPLPLPVTEYMKDFASVESREEFLRLLERADEVIELPPARTRAAAYEAAGNYVLDNCEVLVTVWDGQRAQGQGGTGSIVERARLRHLPIAWIHAGNRRPGTGEPTSLGAEQGEVTFENL